jgi:hypothetical protein
MNIFTILFHPDLILLPPERLGIIFTQGSDWYDRGGLENLTKIFL